MVNWRVIWRKLGVALNLRDPPTVQPYGWSYFDHIVAVYVTLNTADKRADAVIKKSRDSPDDLTWGDIFILENIVLSLQPPEVVIRNAWIIRERFREITCSTIYNKYVDSGVPKDADTPAKLSLLRADLSRVLDVLHWYYTLIPIREGIRKKLTINCVYMVVFYTGILGAFLVWCYWNQASFIAMVACVIYWGIIGGFVSSQRRMQKIPTEGDPLISVFGLDNAGYYLWLSPLLGAIFALILALMFVAGILKGTVFPEFSDPHIKGEGLSFLEFVWKTLPKSGEDYAKLFVWAFLAGFAERLVPDSLDQLTSKLGPGKNSVPSGASSNLPPPLISSAQPGSPDGGAGQKTAITSETLEDVLHSGEAPKATGAGDDGPQVEPVPPPDGN